MLTKKAPDQEIMAIFSEHQLGEFPLVSSNWPRLKYKPIIQAVQAGKKEGILKIAETSISKCSYHIKHFPARKVIFSEGNIFDPIWWYGCKAHSPQ